MTKKVQQPDAWWEVTPGRWVAETAALHGAGATWRRMRPYVGASDPVMRISVKWPWQGNTVRLHVTFPRAYPYVAPLVSAPDGIPGVTRHVGRDGGVCVLGDPSNDWQPGTTLAQLLTMQLPQLVAAESESVPAGVEVVEPVGALDGLGTFDPLALLVDGGMAEVPDNADQGTVTLAVGGSAHSFVAAIHTVADTSGGTLATSTTGWPGFNSSGIPVSWRRLHTPVTIRTTAKDLWAATVPLPQPGPAIRSVRRGALELRLLLVRDEISHRTQGWRWVLLLKDRHGLLTAVGEPGGPADIAARTPSLAGLADKSVTIIGAGALGSEIARHLARAGVGRLTSIDADVVTAATSCRQLPPRYAGALKAKALASVVLEINPHAKVNALTGNAGYNIPADMLAPALAAHVVVDAAAEEGVTRWLTTTHRGLPLIVATATWGAWGGTVTRLPATGGGCWCCLAWHRADETVPWPTEQPRSEHETGGCSSPSYTGTGYDLADISTHAARLAIATMLDTGAEWPDLHVLSHRSASGLPVAPSWETAELTVHRSCRRHATKASESPGDSGALAS